MNVASHSQNSCLTEIEAWVDRGREANTESRYAGQSALQGGDRLGWVAHIRRWRRCGQDRLVELIERRRPQPKLLSICERLDLGPKKSLTVVAYEGRRFLVASGADTVAAMLEISPTTEQANANDRLPLVWPARWSER